MPPDRPSPEVRMNPRIELVGWLLFFSGSILSLGEGSFDGVSFDGVSFDWGSLTDVSVDDVSFDGVSRGGPSFDWGACFDVGESFGLGMLLRGVVLDDAVEGAVDLLGKAPPAGRNPEGVETT